MPANGMKLERKYKTALMAFESLPTNYLAITRAHSKQPLAPRDVRDVKG